MPKVFCFCYWLIVLLFINFSFLPPVFAAPVISVVGLPDVATASAKFDVVILLSNLEPAAKYKVKALGGSPASNLQKLYTLGQDGQSWLAWNGSWDSMPEVLSDASGSGQLTASNKFYDDFEGDAVYKVRIKKVGGNNYYDSQELSLVVNPGPISTATPIPTPLPTSSPLPTMVPSPTIPSSPTPTPNLTAICHLLIAKDESGREINNAKIYIDGQYIHHYLPETLHFCPGCYCDPDRQVACHLGQHQINIRKDGYQDWQWTNNFVGNNNYQQQPMLQLIISPTPSLAPTPLLLPSAMATVSGILRVASISSEGEVKGAQVSSAASRVKNKKVSPNLALPLIFVGSGVTMIGSYFILKNGSGVAAEKDW